MKAPSPRREVPNVSSLVEAQLAVDAEQRALEQSFRQ